MSRNYQTLTGDTIIRKVRGKNICNAIICVLGYLAVTALVIYLLHMTSTQHRYLYAIIGLLLCILFYAGLTFWLKRTLSTLKDVSRARVFRKYGSPEQLAEIISAGAAHPLLESRHALIADTFIMKHNDYESYIPFSDVILCYRKEQRTNGVLTGIYLVVQDVYGEKIEYPFKMGKSHLGEMTDVMRHISEQAPNAAFGYTQQNLKYADANVKAIPE